MGGVGDLDGALDGVALTALLTYHPEMCDNPDVADQVCATVVLPQTVT